LSNNSQAPVKAARKIKAIQIAPVIIIIVSVVGALYFSGTFDGVNIPSNLTPTRDIIGTWTTPLSTRFQIATDASSATFENVGSENRTMTLTITSTNQENIVNVKVEYSYANRQLISESGYIPDASPMFLTGTINGTQLTLTQNDSGVINQIGSVGVFTFTTSKMEGTWHDHWSGVYEQNVYTPTNGLKLIKL
jgi:flagellar basal body-associated protein FliL